MLLLPQIEIQTPKAKFKLNEILVKFNLQFHQDAVSWQIGIEVLDRQNLGCVSCRQTDFNTNRLERQIQSKQMFIGGK